MTTKPLITVLTPCYNAETYMQRFLDCILIQSYENIELVLINDGSTDNTEEIILNNKEKLENKCSKFIYIKQNNQGLGATIDNGLKYVNGKYLTWPDYDDILYPNYLEKKVQFMEDNPDISICFNPVDVVIEDDINTIIQKFERISNNDDKLINDYLFCKNVLFEPITLCIKTKDFWEINPSKSIYPSRQGQDWQMILPMIYYYKFGYINETLAKYVIRKDSHSRIHNKQFFKRCVGLLLLRVHTFKRMKIPITKQLYYNSLSIIYFSKLIIRELFVRIFFLRQIKKMLKYYF